MRTQQAEVHLTLFRGSGHDLGAVQALVRGRASRRKTAGPQTVLTHPQAGVEQAGRRADAEMICDAEAVRDYILAPLEEISETGY
jgi:hypothetical protein